MLLLRSILFEIFYWPVSIFFGVSLALCSFFTPASFVKAALISYSRIMRGAMHLILGIKIEYKGKEKLPQGPFILAAKHQSWGDGFVAVSEFGDLTFVVGGFLESYPFVGLILKKADAIVVDVSGGHKRGQRIIGAFDAAAKYGRGILIFPEGHMVKIKDRISYKSGVWRFQKATKWPVVPLATNLGLFWSGEDFIKEPGVAVVEVLDPIPYGLKREEFMIKLEAVLNDNSKRLFAEGVKADPGLSQAGIVWPDAITESGDHSI